MTVEEELNKLLDLERAADELLQRLEELELESRAYREAAQEVGKATAHVVELVEKLRDVAGRMDAVVEGLRENQYAAIVDGLHQVRDETERLTGQVKTSERAVADLAASSERQLRSIAQLNRRLTLGFLMLGGATSLSLAAAAVAALR